MKGCCLAAAIAAVLWSASCTRDQKSAQAAALEDAYRSGVLTRAEYEAKKATLQGTGQMAALEEAYRSGVLTKQEYDAKRAALLAPAPAISPVAATPVPAAAAPPTQVVAAPPPVIAPPTEMAPTPSPAVAAAPPPATIPSAPMAAVPPPQSQPPAAQPLASPAAHGNYLVLKKAQIVDPTGFGRPVVSASLLIPSDWQFQGATQWNVKDTCNTVNTSLRATGPDGRAYETFPDYRWAWADNPNFLKIDFQQKARMGTHACDVMPPMSAADYLKRVLPRLRPNAQVTGMEPLPKAMQSLQQQARQSEQMAAQYGLRETVRPDVVRARLRYNLNGQAVEEWIVVQTLVTGIAGPLGATYNCGASVNAARAPQGQLDSSEKFFLMIISTFRYNPEWQRLWNQLSGNVQATAQKGIHDRSQIVAQTAEDVGNIRRQQFENQNKSQDHVFGQWSQTTLGVETYRNPASGETFDLSNQYNHAWVNDRNEIVLSDQEGWDPSVALKGNWTAMQHVKQ